MVDDILIKTTARLEDTQEPLKQRPIIQIDRQALQNTIRASIDSGRDNPFRPDGKIYKSADPIVDYYKYGPNQSRAQSPTDSQLLLGIKETEKKETKNEKKRGRRKLSCWKKWLCCCCCCGLCNRDGKVQEQEEVTDPSGLSGEKKTSSKLSGLNDISQYSSVPAIDSKAKEYKQTKIVILKDNESPANEEKDEAKKSGEETRTKSTRCTIS